MKLHNLAGILATVAGITPTVLGTTIESGLYGTIAVAHKYAGFVTFKHSPHPDSDWQVQGTHNDHFIIRHRGTGLYINCDGGKDEPFVGAVCDLQEKPTEFDLTKAPHGSDSFKITIPNRSLSWGLSSETGVLLLKKTFRPQTFKFVD